MSTVCHLDEANFEETTSKGVALVDFWATWCGPCQMLGPVLEQLAAEVGDKAVIAKVDVDENQALATKFSVRNIPAIFILKDGEVVEQFVGYKDKSFLQQALDRASA